MAFVSVRVVLCIADTIRSALAEAFITKFTVHVLPTVGYDCGFKMRIWSVGGGDDVDMEEYNEIVEV